MPLLWKVIFAAHCSSTHHKLAMDALRHLRGPQAASWRDLFLSHYAAYLKGAKAPDGVFRDFKNHVLHVQEGYWGGAVQAARDWYCRTVTAFHECRWAEGVYSAGVLSHYYTDPIQPFHTGQTEEEGKIHRAAEWSIAKSYAELRDLLEGRLGGYPQMEAPRGERWLETMVQEGAKASNPHYHVVIDHYDLDRGVKNPPQGLDEELKVRIASLIGHATVGFARILERALEEAAVAPPKTSLALETFLATLSIPIAWVVRQIQDARERAAIQDIYEEVQITGKAVLTLPDDDWEVRTMHAREVLNVSRRSLDAKPAGPTGTRHGRRAEEKLPSIESFASPARAGSPVRAHDPIAGPGATRVAHASPSTGAAVPPSSSPDRFYLERSSPVVDAPAIGPKTAARLEAIGIRSVQDLLSCSPEETARRIGQSWITSATVRDWQAQASLVCRVAGLRGHDAQLLVACAVREPEQLAAAAAEQLLRAVGSVAASAQGQKILRGAKQPDLEEVSGWITAARRARSGRAA